MSERILAFILFLILPFFGFSQFTFSGQIVDFETKTPIPCAKIEVYYNDNDSVKMAFSDSNGKFSFDSIQSRNIFVSINRLDYDSYDEKIDLDSVRGEMIIELFAYGYEPYITDVTKEEMADFTVISIAYNPFLESFNSKYKSSFNFSIYAFEYKWKLNKIQQLGLRYSLLDFAWYKYGDNFSSTVFPNIKERYFSFSASAFIYNRFIISKQKETGKRGLFLDLGVGYRLPYIFRYSYFPDKNTKTTYKKIIKYNDAELFGRIGYGSIAIYGTYRFFDMMKGIYFEPPRFTIGIETPIIFTDN